MESEQKPGKIHQAIVNVMAEIGHIEKKQLNKAQNFHFRGVGDAMAACQPLFIKHKMYVRPFKVVADDTKPNIGKDGKPYGIHSRQTIVYRATSAEDGSYVDSESTGEAIDYGDKSAGKVMSVSFKFLLFQMFCIPDHDPEHDPDGQSPQAGAGQQDDKGKGGQGSRQQGGRQAPQGQPNAGDDAKTKALQDLVALLKRKGVTGKAVLPWLSELTNPKRQLAKLSDIEGGEFKVMEKAATNLPARGSGPTE